MPDRSRFAVPSGACRRAAAIAVVAGALAGGVFLVLMPIALSLLSPVELPAPFSAQHQPAETLLYLAGFGLILPLALFAAFRLDAAIGDEGAFESLGAVLLACLALAVILIRLLTVAGADRLLMTLLAGAVWIAAAALLARRGGRIGAPPALAWSFALALSLGAAGSVVTWDVVSLPALAVALACGLGLVWIATSGGSRPALPRWALLLLDLLILVLVVLAVPDTVIVHPESAAAGNGLTAFDTDVIQFHQNLFLGAALQVLSGQAVLVGTVSQYGVASIYLIAGFFEIFPIGHGLLGLLDGVLTGCSFGAGYLTLRMAGTRRAVAAVTMAVAVICLAWASRYPEGALLQHGAIRFAMPLLLIPFAVAAERWPARRGILKVAVLLLVGLSSIWALEAFLYVAGTWVAITLLALVWAEPESRLRQLLREAGLALASIVAFQLAFALITLAAAGSLPDWGSYLTYLREFLGDDIGDLTYDVVPFSPGLGVAFAYLASAAGTVALAASAGFRERRATLVALAGLTAYGVILFSYFDNRSIGHVLGYVSLPAVLLAGLWMGLALEQRSGFGRRAQRVVAITAMAGVAVMVGVAWPTARDRAPDSVLAVALPGGDSLRGRWVRLENLPPLVAGADEGQRLIDRYIPGDDPVPVLTIPDLDVNVLVRTGRANGLGITDSKEASWVPGPHVEVVADRVAALRPGQRMLIDSPNLKAWRLIQAEPESSDASIAAEAGTNPIQVVALRDIAERFRLRLVARGDDGLSIVELAPVN